MNLNVPTRKEILKNYGFFEQPAIFHVFKHALDEVGHFLPRSLMELEMFY